MSWSKFVVKRAINKERRRWEMAPERRRSGILTAGGVLAIISGALGIIGGLSLIAVLAWGASRPEYYLAGLGVAYMVWGAILIILGVLAILGGRRALAMTSFGWAITGGIASVLCGGVLGILALIFIAMSKREFEQTPS